MEEKWKNDRSDVRYHRYTQSHCIEVTKGDIFMEQKMRFGLVLGWLAILKRKNWATFEGSFFMFSGAIFFFKHCSVRTKKLHKMKLKKNLKNS